jgi:hypothetical protein
MIMRILALITFLAGCGSTPGMAQGSSFPQPDLGISFISVTNSSKPLEERHINGIFEITNRLNASLHIYNQSIYVSNGSAWKFLSGTTWQSLGVIPPHAQFILQTWVPERGGVYSLALQSSQEEYFSRPFCVSPGPPVGLMSTPQIFFTLTNFVQQIISADNVVIKLESRLQHALGLESLGNIRLSGQKAHEVVQAISSLKEGPDIYAGDEYLELQFYEGDKILGKVLFDNGMVEIDTEYTYQGGILKDLADEMNRKLDEVTERQETEQAEKRIRDEQTGKTNTTRPK